VTPAPLTEAAVLERLRALFKEHFHVEVADDGDDLLAGGLLDSLRLVELLLHIEETFAVSVPLEAVELDDLRSLRGLAALVIARRGPIEAPALRAASGTR